MKRKSVPNHIKSILLTLTIMSLLLGYNANAFTIVCRKVGIGGFDEEERQAQATIGKEKTHKMSEMKVYLSYEQKHLFVYSNFISEGADYPTKIATDQDTDLMTILTNLVFFGEEEPTAAQKTEFKHALPVIRFYVQPALDGSKYKGFRREIEELKD